MRALDFEEFAAGDGYQSPPWTVTEADVVAFKTRPTSEPGRGIVMVRRRPA